MDRFQKFRKALTSVNLILISAVIIACAIYTVNVLADDLMGVELLCDGFPFTEDGMATTVENPLFAPGYYYTTSFAIVENRGTGRAFAELTMPEIYLTRDKYNNVLPTPQLAPSGYVNIDVEILTASAIDGTPLNLNYVNNINDYVRTYGNSGLIYHFVLRDENDPSRIRRHFFEFDKAYEAVKLDSNGNPERDISGNLVYERIPVKLVLKLTIDMKTRAADMTNEWNDARLENFGFRVVPAGQTQIINDTLKLPNEDYYALDFADARTFRITP